MKRFQPKIGLELVIPLAVILFGTLALLVYPQPIWPGILIILLVSSFIIYLFSNTYYLIDQNNLIIHSGFLFHIVIPIKEIRKIEPTISPLSSPALSLTGRLEIHYGKWDSIIIAPKEKQEFLNEINRIKLLL
ncbi:MAG: hypothetical protein RIR51_1277 [Bacteroidota bacterium]